MARRRATFVVFLLLAALMGCGFRMGDPLVTVLYENHTSRAVRVFAEQVGSSRSDSGMSLSAGEVRRATIPVRGERVRIWATDETGRVVLDRTLAWEEFPKSDPLVLPLGP